MDQAQRRQFVRDHRTCVFGYARKDHGPAMTVVYYVMDGDDLLVSTMAARGKPRAVERDGRVSLCILADERHRHPHAPHQHVHALVRSEHADDHRRPAR